MRRTIGDIGINNAYRWFLGYGTYALYLKIKRLLFKKPTKVKETVNSAA